MFDVDWSSFGEEVVRYGLMFGAIFQLICIGAAIFLPCKSETYLETNGSKRSEQNSDDNFNKNFLLESEDSDIDHQGHVRSRVDNMTSQQQLHYRHTHHHTDDQQRAQSTSSNSSRSTKRHEKKKRR